MSQLSSELTAESISFLRTHYQGSLGVQVCVCVSEQKGKPSCSIDMVCVYGKRENHPVPPGGGDILFHGGGGGRGEYTTTSITY